MTYDGYSLENNKIILIQSILIYSPTGIVLIYCVLSKTGIPDENDLYNRYTKEGISKSVISMWYQ